MSEPRTAPYGSWESPITSERLVRGVPRLGEIGVDGTDIYWIEGRPWEGGRQALVRLSADGRKVDVLPAAFHVRSAVHEYGGGSYLAVRGTIYFVHFGDQRIYRMDPGGEPRAITPEGPFRYADFVFDARRARLLSVREEHRTDGLEAKASIVSIPIDGDAPPEVLVEGADFYAAPRVALAGDRMCWMSWDHPNMPWDGTDLWMAELDEPGALRNAVPIAGGPGESIVQPEWSPDGMLHWISDRTGWWNLYRVENDRLTPFLKMEAEFARPQWGFRASTYAFDPEGAVVCLYNERGLWRLGRVPPGGQRLEPVSLPYTSMGGLQLQDRAAVFLAASPTEPASVVKFDFDWSAPTVLHASTTVDIDPAYVSTPRAVEFPTEGGKTAHGFYYPPANPGFRAPESERPPLIVKVHGGPTSAAEAAFSLAHQFWTTRGFALLDVNYGGSTGYGREYRERLRGGWGVVDVDDAVNGARWLAQQDWVDGRRMAISGGSAGGYTVLSALAFRDVFTAGASYFGVSDLEALDRDTHKFESRYTAGLIGAGPDKATLYHQRSPLHHADKITAPVIFFQGTEDKVVPQSQTDSMVRSLRERGLPVAYLSFEGEQHGFRRAENIRRSLEAELYFYGRVFGFRPADAIDPVPIENL